MKWFKHFSDNHRGKSMQTLFDEMGHLGMSSWYILMEMCTEKLEKKWDKKLEDSDCLFEFHQRIVRRNLRISRTNLGRLLDICQGFGLLSFRIVGDIIEIRMPILLDLLESDQKKSRRCSVRIAPESRLESDSKLESEVEVEVVSTQNQTATADKKPLVKENTLRSNSVQSFEDSYKPEVQEFREFIKGLPLGSRPSIKKNVVKIAEHFEFVIDNFETWCNDKINSPAMERIKTDEGRRNYFEVALLRQIGAIAEKEKQ